MQLTKEQFVELFQDEFLRGLGYGSDFKFEIEELENVSDNIPWTRASGTIRIWGEVFAVTVRREEAPRGYHTSWEIETKGETYVELDDAYFFVELLQDMIDQKRSAARDLRQFKDSYAELQKRYDLLEWWMEKLGE